MILSLMAVLASFCAAVAPVTFKGRTIDLPAFLEGYPYSSTFIDMRSSHVIYKKKGPTEQLMLLAFDPASKRPLDLSKGKVISKRDFSKRNLWGAFYSPLTRKVIIRADENNDEVMNVYELDPEAQTERKLTDTHYVFNWELDETGRRLALSVRSGRDERSPGDVRVLDLVTGEEKVLYRDAPEMKVTWGSLSWRPDGKGLLMPFLAGSSRQKWNLAHLPFDGAAPQVLTDTVPVRSTCYAVGWTGQDEFVYGSNEDEFTGLYRGSLQGRPRSLLTPKGENVKDAEIIKARGETYLATIFGNPLRSTMTVAALSSGRTVHHETAGGSMWFGDKHENRLTYGSNDLSNPFKTEEVKISGGRVEKVTRLIYPDALLKKVLHCEPEKVSFETFDKLSAPGENGTLHAYLLKPKSPRTGADARALVHSFYGGSNAYSTTFQIYCAAGYYVISPAPRGTTNFGAAFYNKAEGDWGGGETLDAFAAAKYVAKRLGLDEKQVGIFGGSRGGYDAMRALTFPGEVNGVKESFRFGFGIADFGAYDILRAHESANISQWFAYLTGGDPNKDPQKWRDRSPETHAALLSGPVLLTHGSSDIRMPVAESRAMYAKLKSLGKPAYYVELEGQGHGYQGVEAQTKYYTAILDFLAKVPNN